MKKKVIILGLAALIIGASNYGYSEIGGSNDPLVTKSYVDEKIDEIKSLINNRSSSNSSVNINSTGNELEIVDLKSGQTIIGENGTEIILRAGNAVAIGSELGGISDVTGAKDIDTNQKIEKNHHLIIPRNDGRGLRAKTDSVLMVRGSYRIY